MLKLRVFIWQTQAACVLINIKVARNSASDTSFIQWTVMSFNQYEMRLSQEVKFVNPKWSDKDWTDNRTKVRKYMSLLPNLFAFFISGNTFC